MTNLFELRKKSRSLSPILRIGKNGLTDGVVEELNKLLEKHALIKVKILKSALENDTKAFFFQQLATQTHSSLVDKIGLVAVLYKKPKDDKNRKTLNKLKRV